MTIPNEPLPEAVREQLKRLARDIGNVGAVSERRSDPTADDRMMHARLKQWQDEVWAVHDALKASEVAAQQERAEGRHSMSTDKEPLPEAVREQIAQAAADLSPGPLTHSTWCACLSCKAARRRIEQLWEAAAPPPTPEAR